MSADRFREGALADEWLEEYREGRPDDWATGWVVASYIAQSNLATDPDQPLDPAVTRMLEDWSGWQEKSSGNEEVT